MALHVHVYVANLSALTFWFHKRDGFSWEERNLNKYWVKMLVLMTIYAIGSGILIGHDSCNETQVPGTYALAYGGNFQLNTNWYYFGLIVCVLIGISISILTVYIQEPLVDWDKHCLQGSELNDAISTHWFCHPLCFSFPELDYRVDYQLCEGKMQNAYISALTSHTSYWTNQDIALFVLTQMFSSYGPR